MTNCIVDLFPSEEDLSYVRSQILCPYSDCKGVFLSGSNLNMHLTKHHRKMDLSAKNKGKEYRFFCPIKTCEYAWEKLRHFKKIKYLKQHYLKVHASKHFQCAKCCKGFATLAYKNNHQKNCGLLHQCTCGSKYSSPEALLTHARRKGANHCPVKKADDKTKVAFALGTLLPKPQAEKKTERLIYPKPPDSMPFSIQYIAAIALSELSTPCNLPKVTDRGVQTDISDSGQLRGSRRNTHYVKVSGDRKRKNSQETQTGGMSGKCKKLKISTETQTSSEYLKQKNKNKTAPRKRKKSMETQTREVSTFGLQLIPQDVTLTSCADIKDPYEMKESQFLNEELFVDSSSSSSVEKILGPAMDLKDEEDKDRTKKWLWDSEPFAKTELVSSGNRRSYVTTISKELFRADQELNISNRETDFLKRDQPSIDINKLCNIETQTEVDHFLGECSEDTCFTLCSTTETQTTDDFASMLYSNMCTQTCDDSEVDQLFNFNFVDIETQTAWPDLADYPSL